MKTKENSSKDVYFHSKSGKPSGEFSVDLPVYTINVYWKIIFPKISMEIQI